MQHVLLCYQKFSKSISLLQHEDTETGEKTKTASEVHKTLRFLVAAPPFPRAAQRAAETGNVNVRRLLLANVFDDGLVDALDIDHGLNYTACTVRARLGDFFWRRRVVAVGTRAGFGFGRLGRLGRLGRFGRLRRFGVFG